MTVTDGSLKQIAASDSSVPAVVMNLYGYHGLGVARSLGRLGIPICGIYPNKNASGFFSKYLNNGVIFNTENQSNKQNIGHFLSLGKSIGKKSLLIPTTDKNAVFISDFADKLEKYFIFPHNSPKLTRSLTDKKNLYFLAKQHGIFTPKTLFPTSLNDVKECLKENTFPLMFKGIDGNKALQISGQRMFVTKTKKELLSLYDRFENFLNPNFMLQEYIPSDENSLWMFSGYFNERSECLFGITAKKIRQYPPYAGVTSLGICLSNETIMETTKRFMKKIDYKGPVDVDYLFDKRDGEYKIIDVNPRVGASFRLFVADNGLDVVQAEYLDLTGQRVPESHIVQGRKWVVEDYDIISGLNYARNKKLTLFQWVQSLRGIKEAAWFARDDLLPFFSMLAVFGRTLTQNNRSNRK